MMSPIEGDEALAVDVSLIDALVKNLSSPLTNAGVVAIGNAADTLVDVALRGQVYRDAITDAGAIPPLVSLLCSGEDGLACSSAHLLRALADASQPSCGACREAGALESLTDLMQNGQHFGPATPACAALVHIISDNSLNKEELIRLKTIPLLVKFLSAGPSAEIAAHAANALRELAVDSPQRRELIAAAGAIKPLTALLTNLDQPASIAAVSALLALSMAEPLHPQLGDAGRQCWRLVDSITSVQTADPSSAPRGASGASSAPHDGQQGGGSQGAGGGGRLQAMCLIAVLFCESKVGNRAAGKLLNRLDIGTHLIRALHAAHSTPGRRYLGVRWSVSDCVYYIRFLSDNEDFADRLVELGAPGALAEVVRSGSGGLEAVSSMVQLGTRGAGMNVVREAQMAGDNVSSTLRAAGSMIEAQFRLDLLCPCTCTGDMQNESDDRDAHSAPGPVRREQSNGSSAAAGRGSLDGGRQKPSVGQGDSPRGAAGARGAAPEGAGGASGDDYSAGGGGARAEAARTANGRLAAAGGEKVTRAHSFGQLDREGGAY